MISFHFTKLPGFYVIDKATHFFLLPQEWASPDSCSGLANVLFQILKRLDGKRRSDSNLGLNLSFDRFVTYREHTTFGVMDQNDLLGS